MRDGEEWVFRDGMWYLVDDDGAAVQIKGDEGPVRWVASRGADCWVWETFYAGERQDSGTVSDAQEALMTGMYRASVQALDTKPSYCPRPEEDNCWECPKRAAHRDCFGNEIYMQVPRLS